MGTGILRDWLWAGPYALGRPRGALAKPHQALREGTWPRRPCASQVRSCIFTNARISTVRGVVAPAFTAGVWVLNLEVAPTGSGPLTIAPQRSGDVLNGVNTGIPASHKGGNGKSW